jgi:hypothetical protein
MPDESVRAHRCDLSDTELDLLDGGHWLPETRLERAVALPGFLADTPGYRLVKPPQTRFASSQHLAQKILK